MMRTRRQRCYLQPEEVSLAIGRGGMNIKLASMLTEYTIDVFREVDENEADEDIYLDEFSDEIDQWVIDAIKGIGLDTAKQVLNAPRNLLIEKADLEEETVDQCTQRVARRIRTIIPLPASACRESNFKNRRINNL